MKILLLLIPLTALLLAGTWFLVLNGGETSANLVLEGLPEDAFYQGGFELRPATDAKAVPIPKSQAEESAVAYKEGGVSRQTELVWLSSTREPYSYKDRLVWVIN